MDLKKKSGNTTPKKSPGRNDLGKADGTKAVLLLEECSPISVFYIAMDISIVHGKVH